MSTTLATCSRCAWTYEHGESGPIVALLAHYQEAHPTIITAYQTPPDPTPEGAPRWIPNV